MKGVIEVPWATKICGAIKVSKWILIHSIMKKINLFILKRNKTQKFIYHALKYLPESLSKLTSNIDFFSNFHEKSVFEPPAGFVAISKLSLLR